MMKEANGLLSIRGLRTHFQTRRGPVRAVDGVDLDIDHGQIVGVVGETGCGKSVTALSVMRLVASPPGKIVGGEVFFEGEDLLRKPESHMRKIRGNDIAMIFQEPGSSLNPVFTVADQIAETIELHQGLNSDDAHEKAKEMMHLVGVPDVDRRAKNYPHQFSGGMNQRIMIAMALSCNPKLLVADEPVTALDVTIQAQILNLLVKLRDDLGTSIWLITHDLGVIAQTCEQVKVMYMGKIVESADVYTIFTNPMHPYTEGLLKSIPRVDMEQEDLAAIPGVVPSPHNLPTGCRFNTRCYLADAECSSVEPELIEKAPGHNVACIKV